jgi:hypothetical protein
MKWLTIFTALVLLAGGVIPSCGKLESPYVAPRPGSESFPLMTSTMEAPPYGETTDLIAGRTIDIGSIHCWIVGDSLYVLYSTEGDWRLAETQLIVASSLADIPVTRSENPRIGHFPLKGKHEPPVTECKFALELEAWGFENAENLIIAAHADVVRLSGDGSVIQKEGAWGAGTQFGELPPADQDAIERPPVAKDKSGIIIVKAEPEERGNWAMYFKVNVKKLRGLILWNKLGSAYEVTHSVVGPNGIIVGDLAYLPCEYGNGFRPLERTGDHNIPDNFIDFPGLNLGPRGCIEFWYHPDWSDWSVGHCVEPLYYGIIENSQNLYLQIQYNDWQGFLGVGGRDPNNVESVAKDHIPGAIPGWSTVQPFHVALVWDGTQPAAMNRIRFFINGSEATPARYFLGNPHFVGWLPNAVLRMGSRTYSGDWNRHNWEGSEGIIDNLKIWSYPKTDFSDRFTE